MEPQRFERSLRLNGTLLAREGIEVRPEISGVVREVGFREGGFVEEGTPLLRLDDRELQAELRSVQAELALAERNEERLDDLRARGATSQRDYDEALSRLNVLRARVELLETRISKSAVRAPFSGVVGLRRVSPGDFVTPQEVITVLNAIDELKVDFSVPERHQGDLREGLSIRVSAGGLTEPREGTIQAIEPQVDPATRTLTARAVVNNDDARLLPGNFAVIELVFAVNDDAVLVPATALRPGLRETRLFVVKDDKAEERVVRIGARMERHVEIIEGVEMGDEVVVRGAEALRSGQSVRRQES
ncbi:MAG: efflux RND transporter periplasmic adaptor subunit [Opitutales bacterium]|nr:efflux RND transporter periplasmic adaptor subunit [Opitutales bacterium]